MGTAPVLTMYCPTCDKLGTPTLLQRQGFTHACSNGHCWNDMGELIAAKPRTETKLAQKAAPAGSMQITVTVSPQLHQAATQKYGEKLNASFCGLLGVMMDPQAFIVTSDDLKQIEQHSGQKVTQLRDLIGVLFNLARDNGSTREENERLDKRVRELLRTRGRAAEEFTFLPRSEETRKHLEAKAQSVNITVESLVSQFVEHAVKTGIL